MSSGVGIQKYPIQPGDIDSAITPGIYSDTRGIDTDIGYPQCHPISSTKVLNDPLKDMNVVIVRSQIQCQSPGWSNIWVWNWLPPPPTSSLPYPNISRNICVTKDNVDMESPPPPSCWILFIAVACYPIPYPLGYVQLLSL